MKTIPVLAIVLAASPVFADELTSTASSRPAVRISVEADPLDFAAYDGWSLFSVIQPDAFGPWAIRFGTGRAYLPKVFTESGNPGWSFGLDPVTTVGVQRFFRERRGGLFVMSALGYESMVFTGPSGGKATITAASIQIGAGYRWYPSDTLGLVISADLGGVSSFYRSADPMVDGEQYKIPIVSPIGELFVGWDFDFGRVAQK